MEIYEILSLIISAITLVIGLYGIWFGLKQFKNGKMVSKSQFVNDMIQKIRYDHDVSDIIYMVDYNEFIYDEHFHGNKDLEYKTDKTLTSFSYLVYLSTKKIFSADEFAFFTYEIQRLLKNNHIKNYLYNIYHFSGKCEAECPFTHLICYGQLNKILSEDFFDKTACDNHEVYKKIINI